MIGFFIPIIEALVAGYAAAFAVYAGLLFLITRLGARVLTKGNTATWIYTALHAITWCLMALAGAYVCCYIAPLPPYGLVGFPVCLALAFALVLLRAFRQLSGQMSVLALLLNLCGIAAGTTAALYWLSVFMILRAA